MSEAISTAVFPDGAWPRPDRLCQSKAWTGASEGNAEASVTVREAPAAIAIAFGFSAAVGISFGVLSRSQGISFESDPGAPVRVIPYGNREKSGDIQTRGLRIG